MFPAHEGCSEFICAPTVVALRYLVYGVTVKLVLLEAVPPGVVTVIFPVTAPVGTVAVIWVSEFTVKLVAATPPNVTFVACVRLTPVMVTGVPTAPEVGLKVLTCGVTLNFLLLRSLPAGVVTVTAAVVAPAGTTAVR